MKALIKIFGSTIFTTSILLLTFAVIIKTFLLNTDAVKDTYRQNATYENISGIVSDELKRNIKAPVDAPEFTLIPETEQQRLIDQIDTIHNLFPASRVQNIIEENLDRILPFINGRTAELTVYFPIGDWGIPNELISGSVLSEFSANTDSQTLINLFVPSSQGEARNFLATVNSIGPLLTKVILGLSILSLAMFILVFLVEEKRKRLRTSGVLFIWLGIYVLISSLAVKGLIGSLQDSTVFTNENLATKISQQLIPPLIVEISDRLLISGILFMVVGVCFIAGWFFINKKFPVIQKTTAGTNTTEPAGAPDAIKQEEGTVPSVNRLD